MIKYIASFMRYHKKNKWIKKQYQKTNLKDNWERGGDRERKIEKKVVDNRDSWKRKKGLWNLEGHFSPEKIRISLILYASPFFDTWSFSNNLAPIQMTVRNKTPWYLFFVVVVFVKIPCGSSKLLRPFYEVLYIAVARWL